MREAWVSDCVERMLESYNYRVRSGGVWCPRCRRVLAPYPGRPDLKAVHPYRRTLYIEVKDLPSSSDSFSFSEVKPEQRNGLGDRLVQGFLVYIALGIIRDANGADRLKAIYLVPWEEWLQVEEKIRPHQDTIPLVAGKHKRRALQENKLDIHHLLSGYALIKVKRGWAVPMLHQAYKHILGGQP